MFGEDLAKSVHKATEQWSAIASADDFAEALSVCNTLSEEVEPRLQAAFSQHQANGGDLLDLTELHPLMPGMREIYVAEGSALVVLLDVDTWRSKATSTTETIDDDYVNLMEKAYDSLRPVGWGSWQQRTWDYGGCSPLGSGLHRDLLIAGDAITTQDIHFTDEVKALRTEVLRDILEGNAEFPYCDTSDQSPTSSDLLIVEANEILEQVALSDDEKTALSNRIRARFITSRGPTP